MPGCPGREASAMGIDTDRIDEATLALLYLGLHDRWRAWKGFDWDAMDRLHAKGMTSNAATGANRPAGRRRGARTRGAPVSEYQYYEFLAVDRPLTEPEMRELRAVSSRAVITPTRFTNHYEWGDFKGDPRAWMERYFDAFLYFANWGTHELMLRLPRRALEPATAKLYCRGDAASARVKGGNVILEFLS